MSGLGNRNGVLTAGGHAVHRVANGRRSEPEGEPERRSDQVPAVERYMELSARHMHRVATLPIEDRFISGCSCGWALLSSPDVSETEAMLAGSRHAIEEAKKLQQKLEGEPDAG
jgi:hypothetical protein